VNLSNLQNFNTGGTVHVIINNQIGFTTNPESYCPTLYCTDVAKSVGAPVFHVNSNDPEAVVYVCELAMEWRQRFHKDVVVDIVCYRKLGHNEGDDPRFTQPLMYQKIDKLRNVLEIYTEKLIEEKVVDKTNVDEMIETAKEFLNQALEESKNVPNPGYQMNPIFYHNRPHPHHLGINGANNDTNGDSSSFGAVHMHLDRSLSEIQSDSYQNFDVSSTFLSSWNDSPWSDLKSPAQLARIKDTCISVDTFRKVGKALYTVPEGFHLHPFLQRQLDRRRIMFETGEMIDWATAEALAFGSLLLEGNHIRMSGQDVERGTFAQRHAILHDQLDGTTYCPLNHISNEQEKFIITNSSLAEFAAIGFELGYSLQNPNSLVIWEAQFGDFANEAQVIFDQFISSGEAKWNRQSGIVVLLPHGYDGGGPEHSSARIERYLQMSNSDADNIPPMDEEIRKQIQESNWQLLNCTTPANYFHAIRRQIHREFRKPLLFFTAKNLFRHRLAISTLRDFCNERRFERIIPETSVENLLPSEYISKLILCSGKIYYDLFERRELRGIKDIAIVRIEQLMPFPFDLIAEQGRKYPNAEVVWVQEEPKNMGCWYWISHHLRSALKGSRGESFFPKCVSRPAAAATATGNIIEHNAQVQQLLSEAMAPIGL